MSLVILSASLTIPSTSASHADACGTIKSEGKYIGSYKGDWYASAFAKRQYNYFGMLLKNPKCSTPLDNVGTAREMVKQVLGACASNMSEFMNGYGKSTSNWICSWAKNNKKYASKVG